MFDLLKMYFYQGMQTIKNIEDARPPAIFRGLPVIHQEKCPEGCKACADVCSTGAINTNPLRIDLKKCLFCPDCTLSCSERIISYSNNPALSATDPDSLVMTFHSKGPVITTSKTIKKLFKRSLKLRSISAGGCNGCEMELNALANVHFDIGRYGIDFVASPRHADGIVLTGPLTVNMTHAFFEAIQATPEPKLIILVGACALSGGLFRKSDAIDRSLLSKLKIALYVPGCPPHPLTFFKGLLDFLGVK